MIYNLEKSSVFFFLFVFKCRRIYMQLELFLIWHSYSMPLCFHKIFFIMYLIISLLFYKRTWKALISNNHRRTPHTMDRFPTFVQRLQWYIRSEKGKLWWWISTNWTIWWNILANKSELPLGFQIRVGKQ